MVVDLGVQLLRYLAVSGLFVTVALAFTGGLQGTGEDNYDQEDLPGDADRCVADIADIVTNHRVVYNALTPSDHVL